MRSHAAAFAWQFRRHHRWGLVAIAAYLVILGSIKIVVIERGQHIVFDEMTFAFFVAVPLTSTWVYFLSIFTFGLSGDVAARESMFPTRMLTLPVTTTTLAGIPMLYGTISIAILWAAGRLVALWPSDFDVPLIWPALLAASMLAWTQALTWMPYPMRGLRVIVSVIWLATIDAIVMVALHVKASEGVMLAILSPNLPLAFLAARSAVARARRGELPEWPPWFPSTRRFVPAGWRRRAPFSSPRRAQMWFEWRQYGRSLPWLIAIVLPFELALLFPFRETPELIFEVLILIAFTPPVMAVFVAATASRGGPASADGHGLSPFVALRPLTDASLIAAKMKAMALSTVGAWTLILVATPVVLRLSGAATVVMERAHRFVEVMEMPRAVAIALLVLAALMASTWKQLVQSLYVGMSGREWVVKGSVFATLVILAVALPLAVWIHQSRVAAAMLWNNFGVIVAALVCCKLLAAVWIAMRLQRERLMSGRALLTGAIGWDVVVFALYGLLMWIVPILLIRNEILVLIAILEVPLARVAAAPLALAWNRHR